MPGPLIACATRVPADYGALVWLVTIDGDDPAPVTWRSVHGTPTDHRTPPRKPFEADSFQPPLRVGYLDRAAKGCASAWAEYRASALRKHFAHRFEQPRVFEPS